MLKIDLTKITLFSFNQVSIAVLIVVRCHLATTMTLGYLDWSVALLTHIHPIALAALVASVHRWRLIGMQVWLWIAIEGQLWFIHLVACSLKHPFHTRRLINPCCLFRHARHRVVVSKHLPSDCLIIFLRFHSCRNYLRDRLINLTRCCFNFFPHVVSEWTKLAKVITIFAQKLSSFFVAADWIQLLQIFGLNLEHTVSLWN